MTKFKLVSNFFIVSQHSTTMLTVANLIIAIKVDTAKSFNRFFHRDYSHITYLI